ncbi:MAG: enoyl-CoA hydratase-related protein, partial [Ilumatobacteraceae bacterium]
GAQFGLINRVVPGEQLLAAARELAAGVVASAPLSVAAILDIGRRTAQMDPIEAMSAIKTFESYRSAVDSEDAEEGNLSFAEKRPPVWKGR